MKHQSHIFGRVLCTKSVENTEINLSNTDKRVPRLHDDWMTPVEREDRYFQNTTLTIQRKVGMEVNKKDNLLPRNVERNYIVLPPVQDDQPLVIDLVESDDDEPRYPVRYNIGGGVDTSIYDLDESMWNNEDFLMRCGGNNTVADNELQAILRNNLTYLSSVDTYSANLHSTPSVMYIEDKLQTSEENVCAHCHPYYLAARLGAKDDDNPTHNDILRGSSSE